MKSIEEKVMTTEETNALIEELSRPLEAESNQPNDYAQVVLDLRKRAEFIENALKEAKKHLENGERALVDRMIELQLESFKNDDGVLFSQREIVYPRVLAENRDLQMEWLRENGHGEVIKETVNSNTFSKMVRDEYLEAGLEIPGFILVEPIRKLYVRGA